MNLAAFEHQLKRNFREKQKFEKKIRAIRRLQQLRLEGARLEKNQKEKLETAVARKGLIETRLRDWAKSGAISCSVHHHLFGSSSGFADCAPAPGIVPYNVRARNQ